MYKTSRIYFFNERCFCCNWHKFGGCTMGCLRWAVSWASSTHGNEAHELRRSTRASAALGVQTGATAPTAEYIYLIKAGVVVAGADVAKMAALYAVSCTYCQEEINGVRVQCCECIDFDICLQCFSSGAEIGEHKNDHSYRLIEPCAGGVFGGRDDWTGQEELQLLEAMDLCGFGSWKYVSQQIKTRTPEEVKEKYMSRYFDGKIGRATWEEVSDRRPKLIDHTTQDRGPLAPEVTSRLPPLDATPDEALQLGYMAHRDDFEKEYDPDAERLVSALQLTMSEDSEMEKALKLAQIDMYTRRLRERNLRKRLVRDYQLVAKFFAPERPEAPKPELNKDQRELRDKMKVFSQFLTSGEHQRLIESIDKERELRHRLGELLKYRGLGLTTHDEIIHYEQHAAFQHQQRMRHRKSGSSGFRTTEEHHSENGDGAASPSSTDGRPTSPRDDKPDSSSGSCSRLVDNIELPPIASLPQANLLSHSELQDNINSNGRRSGQAASEDGSDDEPPTIKDIITEYLSESGWLSRSSLD